MQNPVQRQKLKSRKKSNCWVTDIYIMYINIYIFSLATKCYSAKFSKFLYLQIYQLIQTPRHDLCVCLYLNPTPTGLFLGQHFFSRKLLGLIFVSLLFLLTCVILESPQKTILTDFHKFINPNYIGG